MKFLWGALACAAVIAPGVALADPPNAYGKCVSAANHYEHDKGYRGTQLAAKKFDEREEVEANLLGGSKNDPDVNCLEEFKNGNDEPGWEDYDEKK
jgi:hypothetical protein